MKLGTLLGARPPFIKTSAVPADLAHQTGATEMVAHAGQSFEANMLRAFVDQCYLIQRVSDQGLLYPRIFICHG